MDRVGLIVCVYIPSLGYLQMGIMGLFYSSDLSFCCDSLSAAGLTALSPGRPRPLTAEHRLFHHHRTISIPQMLIQ